MNYLEIGFTCKEIPQWQQDLLINDLSTIGFDTFEESDEGFKAYIPEADFHLSSLQQFLAPLKENADISYVINTIPQQNWNKLWESNFQPIELAGKCYVRATFHEPREDYPLEIVVDPKMAFGTGHHQTTSLMMELLLDETSMSSQNAQTEKGAKVLDMGCGTGILGILALKLGAESVFAIDNDPVCVKSTAENALLNHVDNLSVVCGDSNLIPHEDFTLILANINRNILLEQMSHYAAAIRKKGILLISGFYGEDLSQLKTKAESKGFEYLSCLTRDNWVAAKLIRK